MSTMSTKGRPSINMQKVGDDITVDAILQMRGSLLYRIYAQKYLLNKFKLCTLRKNSVIWIVESEKLFFPENPFNACRDQLNNRFIFIECFIQGPRGGHANTIFIDMEKKTAEGFEPHGGRVDNWQEQKHDKLQVKLSAKFAEYGLTYIPPNKICPWVGPQNYEVYKISAIGFCATWSIWYIDMRLTYPDVPIEETVAGMLEKLDYLAKKGELQDYLFNYVRSVLAPALKDFPNYNTLFMNYEKEFLQKTDRYKKFESILALYASSDELWDIFIHSPPPLTAHKNKMVSKLKSFF